MREFENSPALSDQLTQWRMQHSAEGSARGVAYQTIRSKIISLELKPGEPLSDKLLADQMGVSRTPVREALIILAASKMVLLKPQRGTFVAPIDTERMAVEQFSRYALEKEIISRAAPLMTQELIWQYEQNIRAYRHYAQTGLPDRELRMLELDNEFHRVAFTAAGREDSFFYMLNNMQHIERMRFLSVIMSQDAVYQDHLEICHALKEGDAAAALVWLERHLNRYLDDLKVVREKYPEYFQIAE